MLVQRLAHWPCRPDTLTVFECAPLHRFDDVMPFWIFLWAAPLELAMVLLMVGGGWGQGQFWWMLNAGVAGPAALGRWTRGPGFRAPNIANPLPGLCNPVSTRYTTRTQ